MLDIIRQPPGIAVGSRSRGTPTHLFRRLIPLPHLWEYAPLWWKPPPLSLPTPLAPSVGMGSCGTQGSGCRVLGCSVISALHHHEAPVPPSWQILPDCHSGPPSFVTLHNLVCHHLPPGPIMAPTHPSWGASRYPTTTWLVFPAPQSPPCFLGHHTWNSTPLLPSSERWGPGPTWS